MAKQQILVAEACPTRDVVSRSLRIAPWQNFIPMPDRESRFANDFATIAALSHGVQRIRVRKPGNTNAVDPALLCEALSPPEDFGFRDRKPDLFENGVGKSYDGYRIAFVEGEGFCRMENDGSERAAAPCEISRFKADLAEAARSDERLRRYIDETGIAKA